MATSMITKRGNTWYLTRRVPEIYQSIDDRKMVWKSLKTDSEKRARAKAEGVWAELVEGWDAQLAGKSEDAQLHFVRANQVARSLGLQYLPAAEVANLPIGKILQRVELSKGGGDKAEAALGMVYVPQIMVSDIPLETERVQADKLLDQSPRQYQSWKNERKRGFRELIEAIGGDKQLSELTRVDFMNYREKLINRAKAKEITLKTASRYLVVVLASTRAVADAMDIMLPLDKITIVDSAPVKIRVPMPEVWIREKILATDVLYRMNDHARRIVHMLVNTGARPSEVAGLLVKHLDLSSNIPLMHIRPERRKLKTKNSRRSMPLVGLSLEAAREALAAAEQAEQGEDDWLFPKYAGKDTSASVNKFFRKNGLKPPNGATLYGFRHGFQDRLDATGAQERVAADLMGHALQRERYGEGGGDITRLAAVEKVAL